MHHLLDPRSAGQPAAVPESHVVRDVGAGAVARDEETRGVAVLRPASHGSASAVSGREPDGPRAAARHGPAERGPGVVVGGGHRVLGREAVVHGHGHHERVQEAGLRAGEGRVDRDAKAPPWK
jgi:hypothetical protein